MKQAHILYDGTVQGIGFRYTTRTFADEFNITGWVKNEFDGSVQIAAEGREEQLAQLLSWCEKGPTYANVSKVEYCENELENFKTFWIVR